MKLVTLLLSGLLIAILLLTNTLLTLFIFKQNPSFLISNRKYQTQHTEIINYLLTGNDQKLSEAIPQDELRHIRDVRNIVAKIPLSLFFLFVIAGLLIKKYQNISINEVIKYSFILLFLLILVGVVAFMPLFILFHQIFFPQGNWAFSPESILIQLYPEQFWAVSAGIICILTMMDILVLRLKEERSLKK